MADFNIRPIGTRSAIREGRFRGGIYHLIGLDQRKLRAEFSLPEKFTSPQFLTGYTQKLAQGRMLAGTALKQAFAKGREFQAAGKANLERFLKAHPTVNFISDASNAPFNEAHFAILGGRVLPLCPGSQPVTGKHYVLSTSNGRVSFPLIDTEDNNSIEKADAKSFARTLVNFIAFTDGAKGAV